MPDTSPMQGSPPPYEPPAGLAADRDQLLALATIAIAAHDTADSYVRRMQLELVVRRYAKALEAFGWPAFAALSHVLEIVRDCPGNDMRAERVVKGNIVRWLVDNYYSA